VPEHCGGCGVSNILLNSVWFAFINYGFVSYTRHSQCPCMAFCVRGLIFLSFQLHARYLDVVMSVMNLGSEHASWFKVCNITCGPAV
jgi:hypothetical protein